MSKNVTAAEPTTRRRKRRRRAPTTLSPEGLRIGLHASLASDFQLVLDTPAALKATTNDLCVEALGFLPEEPTRSIMHASLYGFIAPSPPRKATSVAVLRAAYAAVFLLTRLQAPPLSTPLPRPQEGATNAQAQEEVRSTPGRATVRRKRHHRRTAKPGQGQGDTPRRHRSRKAAD